MNSLPQQQMEMSSRVHAQPLYPWEMSPWYHWKGGWVGPRDGLDAVAKRKSLPCMETNSARPTHEQFLHWLCYRGTQVLHKSSNKVLTLISQGIHLYII
jgi:hypothetical protein